MATRHGTRHRYNEGCRCDDCKAANTTYRRGYRQRQQPLSSSRIQKVDSRLSGVADLPQPEVGPVEVGVQAEIGSAAEARPGLAQTALALARLMDDPKAVSQKPAAAKALTSLLDKLHQAGAPGRRGHLAVVRTMTKKGGA